MHNAKKGWKMKEALQKLEIGIEEFLLALLIIIEVLDFFALLPASLEYCEKILSIIAICYLFYKASLTKIIIGKKEKLYDIMIVIGYLLLSMKTLIAFTLTAVKEDSLVKGIYAYLIANAYSIETTTFYIGTAMLIYSAYILVSKRVEKSCILKVIHEEKAKTVLQEIVHFVSIYLVTLAIFATVFTFALEWLAMTIDSAILVILLFFYLFIIVKRGKSMKTESFLKKVSDTSEEFYKKFVNLFCSRKTIITAITGLLVLHLLVDIANFIIPYTTGIYYVWYLPQLGSGHEPLSTLVANDLSLAGTAYAQIGVMITYLINTIAILLMFFGPAYVWAHTYMRKTFRTKNSVDILRKRSNTPDRTNIQDRNDKIKHTCRSRHNDTTDTTHKQQLASNSNIAACSRHILHTIQEECQENH